MTLVCVDCGRSAEPGGRTCPDCGGPLEVRRPEPSLSPGSLADRRFEGLDRYRELLPVSPVTTELGATPLTTAPALADGLGLDRVVVKREGANPTGSARDRALALAVAAARDRGATGVALPSTGPAAVAAAAHAARAGIEAHAFVPSRSRHDAKALVNVHGGEMTVVGGRYDDAVAAFEDAAADLASVAPGDPHRLAGAKTVAYELCEQSGGPDAVVHPTGHGEGLVALARGFADMHALGLAAETPRLYAAQPADCAPIVRAIRDDRPLAPVEHPDTVCGPLEVPDPACGERAVAVASGGVAVDDEDALAAAVDRARSDGLQCSLPAGVALAGTRRLAERTAFGGDATVAVVDPLAGGADADLLRSYLMGQGE